jgi:hypothetical protein
MKSTQPSLNTSKEDKLVLSDEKGRTILQVGSNQFMVRDSHNNLIHRSIDENILLSDGVFWNPGMLKKNPPVYVGICYKCRKRGHGIVTISRAKTCVKCGRLCCPSHRKLLDNQWLCIRCSWYRRIFKFFRFILFEERQEND